MIKFIIFQSPVGCNEQFLRRLGDKTLQHQIRPQMLDIVYHEADIAFAAGTPNDRRD